ncbi:50S ribosomal protein L32 [Candidatus Peregrinibacteria bacterium]|nr:50S ribosomal protein L32 [Candidatus Peregrinibacteria bacterium]
MAKHPVPKKKTSKARSKRRYGSFKTKTLTKLSEGTKLSICPNCKTKILSHTVCPKCGKYRGRQVINKQKEIDKITKIKA